MFLTKKEIAERVAVAAGPLSPLADSLAADLERLLPDEDVFVPAEKAKMTRQGGRCSRDGAFLDFDPTSPRRHRCSVCGSVYEEEEHYRWWIMGYQLWLAERAVHAAALWRMRGITRHKGLAEAILTKLAGQYLKYPNEDNVLGPTRVFFSTYLESIWLLQLAVALDLLEGGEPSTLGGVVRVQVLTPSSELIGSFNEGDSNRQVWNSAALGVAGVLLGRPELTDRAIAAPGGLVDFLQSGLLADGSWYEGENYHLFAHRGLWYLVRLAEHVGAPLRRDLLSRFELGFVAPLKTALPDFTFPSRRDSQYKASLRQWRIAESLELGLARTPDSAELIGGLSTLYAAVPTGDTARWRSTAEAERNVPGVRLTRADLGWKSLLFAMPRIPTTTAGASGSALMEGQGFGVIRADKGLVYAALDYGHSGGSHGHPDRLNLWLVVGNRRVFEDVGTGSYVEQTLHWYRSTLAHNAPLIDGRSQDPISGTLRAWDEQDGVAWIDAEASVAEGVLVRRSLVVAPGHIVDRLEWSADREVTLDLPMHIEADVEGAAWRRGTLSGGSGLEDGFAFVTLAESSEGGAAPRRVIAAPIYGAVHIDVAHEWWNAVAPGPPREHVRSFLVVRANGHRGCITSVWSWTGVVEMTTLDDGVLSLVINGKEFRHHPAGDTWRVVGPDGAEVSLEGRRHARANEVGVPSEGRAPTPTSIPRLAGLVGGVGHLTAGGEGLRFSLGEPHYRGTEASWNEAGAPRAAVVVAATERELLVEVMVPNNDPNFAGARNDNPLDNEHPDVNSDGVQIHLTTAGKGARALTASWLLVPDARSSAVRTTARDDAPEIPFAATWRQTQGGWELLARIDRNAIGPLTAPIGLDVIINEMPRPRERRRGQLVLSGGRGETAYLRGDRQDRARLISMAVSDA